MKLYHATPRVNCSSITIFGLLVSHAQTARKCVWLVAKNRLKQQLKHASVRHGCDASEVAVYEVTLPRGWVIGFERGVWVCERDIGPERLALRHAY